MCMHTHTCAHHTNMHTDMHTHTMYTHAPHIPTHVHTCTHTLLPSASQPARLHRAGPPGNAMKGPERQATWMFPCKARPGHRKPHALLPRASQRCFLASCGPFPPGVGSLPVPWHSAFSGRRRGARTHASSGGEAGKRLASMTSFHLGRLTSCLLGPGL